MINLSLRVENFLSFVKRTVNESFESQVPEKVSVMPLIERKLIDCMLWVS